LLSLSFFAPRGSYENYICMCVFVKNNLGIGHLNKENFSRGSKNNFKSSNQESTVPNTKYKSVLLQVCADVNRHFADTFFSNKIFPIHFIQTKYFLYIYLKQNFSDTFFSNKIFPIHFFKQNFANTFFSKKILPVQFFSNKILPIHFFSNKILPVQFFINQKFGSTFFERRMAFGTVIVY
jgi:hypothetical protein